MIRNRALLLVGAGLAFLAVPRWSAAADEQFPPEVVDFEPYQGNPVFAGTGKDTWDRTIRERGYILREGDTYHLWYTGYNRNRSDAHYHRTMHLGYATSPDGLHWTRHGDNPIFDESWTEDMMVLKHGDTYYMFAEGLHDVAHMLTSTDRVHRPGPLAGPWPARRSADQRQATGPGSLRHADRLGRARPI